MRRHSKGGGGCAVAAIAQPPTWTTYPTGTERALRLSGQPRAGPITASGEPRARDLTGGAGPFRKRAWQVASLIHQTASGVLQ